MTGGGLPRGDLQSALEEFRPRYICTGPATPHILKLRYRVAIDGVWYVAGQLHRMR